MLIISLFLGSTSAAGKSWPIDSEFQDTAEFTEADQSGTEEELSSDVRQEMKKVTEKIKERDQRYVLSSQTNPSKFSENDQDVLSAVKRGRQMEKDDW